ncbi:MAG: AAA family ATPase [Lachnospiraceae bacterium]|nr:AAA family ATPase [Lachnospiraceae bacterium]
MDTITGKIKHIVFTSNDGRYRVLRIKSDTDISHLQESSQLSIAGYDLPTNMALKYTFMGEFTRHKKYGLTFNATSFEPSVADDKESITGYLSSGLFPSIGPKMADRIYATFGKETVDIVENHTERLKEVKGIGEATVAKITKSVRETLAARELSKEFGQYGITAEQCAKLIATFGREARNRVMEDPYCAMHPLHIQFESFDPIALKMGVEVKSPVRIKAAMNSAFSRGMLDGDTGVELQSFAKMVLSLLCYSVTKDELSAFVISQQKEKEVYITNIQTSKGSNQYIFPRYMFEKEARLAKSFVELSKAKIQFKGDINTKVDAAEKLEHITLDEVQRKAVVTALTSPITIITGGPGVGKSQIMKIVSKIYRQSSDNDCMLLAPTGRAARKLSEYAGMDASTIHSFLGLFGDNEETNVVVPKGMVIIDEYSMADTSISDQLLSCMKKGVQMVFVGDIDQLPSVGCGAVLRDFMNSGIVPVIRLTKIYRTDAGSLIYQNVKKINEGNPNIEEGTGFKVIKESDAVRCKDLMRDLYLEKVKKYGLENVMLLVPYKKNTGGTIELNKYLQSIINPPDQTKKEVTVGDEIYRVGDLCMHVIRKSPEASKGDIGIIKSVEVDGRAVKVTAVINGNDVEYDRERLDQLTHAYAMTVHKSQGSEAKAVITCITNNYSAMLYRSIPYVAISRDREDVTLICDDGFEKAVSTVRSNDRVTLLPKYIKYLSA